MEGFSELCRGMSRIELCFFYEQRSTIVRTGGNEETIKVSSCPQFRSCRADNTKKVIVDGKKAGLLEVIQALRVLLIISV